MLVLAGGAFAQSFEIIWDSPQYGYGSGVFTTSGGSSPFTLTSVTGTQAGTPITLLPIGAFGSNNNLIYPGSTLVDTSGFSFSAGTTDFNISWLGGPSYVECSSVDNPTCYYTGVERPLTYLVVNPTPEPSTILLFLSGFGVLLILAGRKVTA